MPNSKREEERKLHIKLFEARVRYMVGDVLIAGMNLTEIKE